MPAIALTSGKPMEFENQVILLTGAAGSIGRALAARLVQQEAYVFLTDREQVALDELCRRLGGRARGRAADVTRADEVDRTVDAVRQAFGGRIDVLINAAGTAGQAAAVERISESTWDEVFAVNCRGSFLFIRRVVPVMKRQRGGSIVNFSSKSGKTGSALLSAYSAAKAAVIGLTQALAYELAPYGIRVNCVCPGIVQDTGVWRSVSADYARAMGLSPEEVVERFTAKVPLGRLARLEDVVEVVCFLASRRAAYMTGQAINVTGGREMH
ncbi:MAG TPA: SDR family oxidoreductase [Planctomycetes bacterium]|nr:SDR family oxidoreductase [Planctomycetota bacterium]